ncbi:MAG: aminopeptidase [Rhodospirillales bacterium]|nr:aminopeptidase [Rhodospirillales bacterium]
MATVVENDLLKDAALIVDVCFSVDEGDVVTIICDDERENEARAVAEVVVERGGWPVIMNNETQVRRGRADVRFPMAPPPNLHRAMVGSDEVIIIANLEWANRFAHVRAVRETCEANGKIASIEPGMGAWGLTKEDLERSAQRTKDAVAALAGKKQVHVTTPLGTDFYVSIEGREPLCLTPYKERGQMMSPIPLWTEVAFAAVEDFTHGIAVVDGVMLGIGLEGQVKEPIRWTIEDGRCVKIEGGSEAERLCKAIEGVENADVIGEFAFGTSEKAPFGTPSEKGRIGTVHLALGDNHNAYPGGQNISSLHLDGVFLNATLQIVDDGTYILKDGEWAL